MPSVISAREFGEIRNCPVCGKRFNIIYFEEWAYRREFSEKTGKDARSHRLLFCSWSCVRKWDKQREEEKQDKREKLYLDYEE